jgi:hypothetical protein
MHENKKEVMLFRGSVNYALFHEDGKKNGGIAPLFVTSA